MGGVTWTGGLGGLGLGQPDGTQRRPAATRYTRLSPCRTGRLHCAAGNLDRFSLFSLNCAPCARLPVAYADVYAPSGVRQKL